MNLSTSLAFKTCISNSIPGFIGLLSFFMYGNLSPFFGSLYVSLSLSSSSSLVHCVPLLLSMKILFTNLNRSLLNSLSFLSPFSWSTFLLPRNILVLLFHLIIINTSQLRLFFSYTIYFVLPSEDVLFSVSLWACLKISFSVGRTNDTLSAHQKWSNRNWKLSVSENKILNRTLEKWAKWLLM